MLPTASVRVNTTITDPQQLADRRWMADSTTIPWLSRTVPLAGARIVEYGCGDGQVSAAFAPHVASVVGLDIDAGAVQRGAERLVAEGIENVRLSAHPVGEIVDVLRDQAGEVDVVLLYAVVEHLTIAERLAVLETARDVAGPEGYVVCIEAPNRLVSFDAHSGQLPYLNWLPLELAERYGERSARTDFVDGLRTARADGGAGVREWWTRFGTGVSFHEFELVFGDLSHHAVAGGYETLMWPGRPLLPEELLLARDLRRQRPDLGPMWSRHWLDLVLRPNAVDPPPLMRPWMAETTESEHVSWTRWETIGIDGPGSRLRCRPDAPTRKVLVGFTAEPGRSTVSVAADGYDLSAVTTHLDAPMMLRYVEFEWEQAAELVELRFSTPAHVFVVAFEL